METYNYKENIPGLPNHHITEDGRLFQLRKNLLTENKTDPYYNMNQDIKFLINQIENKKLRECCGHILLYDDFLKWPGAIGFHHAYEEGLYYHTVEVVNYSLDKARSFPEVDTDVLIAAGIWHDIAKIWDYKLEVVFSEQELPKRFLLLEQTPGCKTGWTNGDFHKKVHHITGSNCEFTHHALSYGVDRETIQKVQHCIASHHGRKEFGSPVEPQTLEAYILSQADMLSAQFGAWKNKKPE